MLSRWRTRGSWELWQWSCRKDVRRFEAALRDPESTQLAHLRSILSCADNTLWARRFGIHARCTLNDFRERVPVHGPEDLAAWTDRIVEGKNHVLSTEPIERLVPTSGTTGKPKLIPMTAKSRREFSTGVNLWLSDSMRIRPEIKSGRCYIATSPALDRVKKTSGAVPIGFAEDGAYLGPLERRILDQVIAVPQSVGSLRDTAWRNATRDYLMRASDLRFLSLWHPDYLNALFDDEELDTLAEKWTKLVLVSTWADGACAEPAQKLMARFPQARHIPKGLWLTEGVVSVPWRSAHPIALLSGFFEFEKNDGSLRLAHELAINEAYRPVITTHAGLYRHRLGDLVKVTGYVHKTPSLRWIGRADHVSDLCGEKLSESHVGQAFDAVGWKESGVLVPVSNEEKPYYICLIPDHRLICFPALRFEEELRKNPHYDWARKVGQLKSLEIRASSSVNISHPNSESCSAPVFHRKSSRLIINRNSAVQPRRTPSTKANR